MFRPVHRQPGALTEVHVNVDVEPSGTTRGARIEEETLQGTPLASCLAGVADSNEFGGFGSREQESKGQRVTVRLTIPVPGPAHSPTGQSAH